MKPDPHFAAQSKEFWANVRTISQEVGYTQRGTGTIKVPTFAEVETRYASLGLTTTHLANATGALTSLGSALFDYFAYRAAVLNDFVRAQLMNKTDAEAEFTKLKQRLIPSCPLPMNKDRKSVV